MRLSSLFGGTGFALSFIEKLADDFSYMCIWSFVLHFGALTVNFDFCPFVIRCNLKLDELAAWYQVNCALTSISYFLAAVVIDQEQKSTRNKSYVICMRNHIVCFFFSNSEVEKWNLKILRKLNIALETTEK